jgi:ATP synthase I chain
MSEKGDREIPTSDSPPSSESEELIFADPAAIERRVWRNIFIVIFLAVITAAVLADLKFMLGIALGGALALLNYKWLHASLRGILAVGSTKTPPGTTMKFVTRWLVIAAAAWAAYQTGYFDAVAILSGLFAPALAVIMEAAYVTFKTFAQRNGER